MHTAERPRLSVVIPAYNNGFALEVTLDSLTRQSMPLEHFEVIVGDDGSAVALAAVADRYADRLHITCVRGESNRGRSANRNAAAALARAGTLVFLDADTVAHPQLLDRHWAYHSRRSWRPGVLLGQRFDIDWAGADALRRGDPVVAAMLDAERGDPRIEDTAHPQRVHDFRRAPWVLGVTHNASVDRESFDRVGGFDEAMTKWGLEDLEFFYRIFHLHRTPDLFHLDAEAIAYHLPHFREPSSGIAFMDNMKYVLRKHPRHDIEAVSTALRSFGRLAGRVRLYDDAVEAFRREGLGRPSALPAAVCDALAAHAALVIGNGVSGLTLGAGSQTYDHAAPLGATNSHLLGLALQEFKIGQLGLIVSIDLWRFLLPEDLWFFVRRALRKADRLELVATRTATDQIALLPVPFIADLKYLTEMLRPSVDITVSQHDSATLLTLR